MRIKLQILLLSLLITLPIGVPAQEVGYIFPLKLAPSLSGSFGELRSTHFHSGVDFRVGGVVGAPIHATADGYISRISVSPTGYGNAIYIDHADGRSSLYGHMLDFAPEIAKWVRQEQYLKESFSIDLYPAPTQFVIKQGDFLGRAGNTGSSGGPHLHFEIRESATQTPINPFKATSLKVPDNIPPVFTRVDFYGISNVNILPERWRVASFGAATSQIVTVPDTFYVAVGGFDRQNNTQAKLAIYDYNYYLDDSLIFTFSLSNLPGGKGRYINSLVEYSAKAASNGSLVKSWIEPGFGITSNTRTQNDGLFILRDDKIHKVKIELIDEYNNKSVRLFSVKRESERSFQPQRDSLKGQFMPWYIPNHYSDSLVRLLLPVGALYSSTLFSLERVVVNDILSFKVHDQSVPLHNSAVLAIKTEVPRDSVLIDKLALLKVLPSGKLSFAGGSYKDGWVEGAIGSFGVYQVGMDTVPPVIIPSFVQNQNLSGRSSLSFTIKDDLSGISSYRVTIDGVWVLSAYDPKNSKLVTELSSDVIKKGVAHTLAIEVIDNKNNKSLLERRFIW